MAIPIIIGLAAIAVGTGIYLATKGTSPNANDTITTNVKVLPISCVNHPTIYTKVGKVRWDEAVLGKYGTKILVPNPSAYILSEIFLSKVIDSIIDHFEISSNSVEYEKSLKSFTEAYHSSQMDVVTISFINGDVMKLNIKELLLEYYNRPLWLTEYKSYFFSVYIPFKGIEILELPFYEYKKLDEAMVRRLIVINFFKDHFKKEVIDISTTWFSNELKVTFDDNSVFRSSELCEIFKYL